MKPLSSITAFLIIGLTSLELQAATSAMDPEAEAVRLGKILRPIPDEEWVNIAGTKITEKYTVVSGDTLSDISKRLFGDPKYWPKVWALNNDRITNPHRIVPGNLIAFSTGTGGSLPGVSVTAASESSRPPGVTAATTDTPIRLTRSTVRSTDWKNLPKQKWETYSAPPPAEVDALGFDKRNKISFHGPTSFDIEAIPAKDPIPFLGEIVGSRSESVYLAMYDTVYIKTEESIKVGETYALTGEPTKFKFDDREGYSYQIMGQVKIEGVQANLFIGTILTAREFVSRGTHLIPLPAKIPVLTPIPGPNALQTTTAFDHHFSTFTSAQHKQVFLGKGTQDGVQPGMIFRAYQHIDPSNDKELTSANFIIDADMMVIQCAETISSALVINSKSPIKEGSSAVLLTDISDLIKNKGFREKGAQGEGQEDLDKLDNGDSLGNDEKKELQQLENWKGNPEGITEGAPNEIGLPPPPPNSEAPPPAPNPDDLNKPSEASENALPPPPSEDVPPPADMPPPSETAAPPAGDAPPPLPMDDSIAPQPSNEPINLEPPPAPAGGD